MVSEIAVIGAGSWGTALSLVLADNGYRVRLWGNRLSTIEEINQDHRNSRYLPGLDLPVEIMGYTCLEQAIKGVDTLLVVVPTAAMAEVCSNLAKVLTTPVTLIHASKGIEPETLQRVSQIIETTLPEHLRKAVVVLSGPSHAEEVSVRHPTTIVASSADRKAAKQIQDLFVNQYLRVYTNPDVVGVELGGALKNIIALGAGMSDGLGFGDNAKAALITRGLAEIARLGVKLGANPLTFLGLTGVGDLVVTCTSQHSRNWRAGNLLGRGHSLQEVLNRMEMVVEGIPTTRAAYRLSRREGVDMPITEVLYQVLFESKNPQDAAEELMERGKTHEMADISLSYHQRLLYDQSLTL